MTRSAYADPIGWPFLPMPENGVMSYPDLEQSVRDSIRIILTTRPGEQLMTPFFGAGLQDFLQDANTIALRTRIQGAILDSLKRYEKRITVDAVDVTPTPGAPSQVDVRIHYRMLRTNRPGQAGVTLRVG